MQCVGHGDDIDIGIDIAIAIAIALSSSCPGNGQQVLPPICYTAPPALRQLLCKYRSRTFHPLGWVGSFHRRLPKSRQPQDHPKCVNVGIHGSSLSHTDPAISRSQPKRIIIMRLCRVYDISSFSKWDRPPAPLPLLSCSSLLLFYCYGDAVTRLFNFHSEAWRGLDPRPSSFLSSLHTNCLN